MPATSQPCLLRFPSLFNKGRSLVFPCDPDGQVRLDTLSERARDNYFFARACVGRDFAVPVIEPFASRAMAPAA